MFVFPNVLTGAGLPGRPCDKCVHPVNGDRGLLAEESEEVRILGKEPVLAQASHLQGNNARTAIAAAAGMVTNQARANVRTSGQWTWRQRRRPPATPTTDDVTTWVVLTGAPINDAPKRTAVEPVWLDSASSGLSRTMRRPIG